MVLAEFDRNVFINCPFDEDYAPILQATIFVVTVLGFNARLATERSDGGETRISKIIELIESSRYSIHDLSRCQARRKGEYFRLNMPFELGIDFGCRQFFGEGRESKRFLILEEKPFRFHAAISDLSGCDIEHHGARYDRAMTKVRNWLRQQTGCAAPGPQALISQYATFQEWEYERRLAEGYSEADIQTYPTFEMLEAMREWVARDQPI